MVKTATTEEKELSILAAIRSAQIVLGTDPSSAPDRGILTNFAAVLTKLSASLQLLKLLLPTPGQTPSDDFQKGFESDFQKLQALEMAMIVAFHMLKKLRIPLGPHFTVQGKLGRVAAAYETTLDRPMTRDRLLPMIKGAVELSRFSGWVVI